MILLDLGGFNFKITNNKNTIIVLIPNIYIKGFDISYILNIAEKYTIDKVIKNKNRSVNLYYFFGGLSYVFIL